MDLKEYFYKALTYEEYVEKLGDNFQLHHLHYTKFNLTESRVNTIAKIKGYDILVLTEPWCGDSLAAIPVLKKITEAGEGWNLKVLLRDQNPDLMNKFLTHGTRSIPLFLFLDNSGNLIFKWGPRIKVAQQIFENNRQMIRAGKISKQEVIKQIRYFYAKDRGKHIFDELLELFHKFQPKKHNHLGNKLREIEVSQ
jgi:hypothetical protein